MTELPIGPVTLLKKATIATLAKTLDAMVIKPLRHSRVVSFLDQLAHELQLEKDRSQESSEPDLILKKLLEDKKKREIVFEAYHRVCLSASRELGPKIIAIVTSRLLQQDRLATDYEEIILMAAEELRDIELRDFARFCRKALQEHDKKRRTINQLNPTMSREMDQQGEMTLYFEKTSRLPLLLIRLENLGIAFNIRNHQGGPLSETIQGVTVGLEVESFIALIERATGPSF